MTPQVSIIMPVYNGEKYLKETMDSILAQTFKNFELIIVDDGSTDKGIDLIKSYVDPRIVLLVNEKNLGISKSLNLAIEKSKSMYIARMDCDDICFPERISEQFKFMEANSDIGVCGSDIEAFNVNSSRVKKFTNKNDAIKIELIFNNPIAHPTVMMRKEILDKYSFKYNSDFDGAEDYDLWERMIGFTKMENIPKILIRYRLHQKQQSRIAPFKQAKIDKIRKRQFEKLGLKMDDIFGLIKANKKYRLYDNWALRKIVYKMYYERFKLFLKQILRWNKY